MKLTIVGIGMAFFLGTTVAMAGEAPKFAAVDGDKDGAISKIEAAEVSGLVVIFDHIDSNKDGVLSGEEYQAVTSEKLGAAAQKTDAAGVSVQLGK